MALCYSVSFLLISLSVSYISATTYWTTTDFNNSGVLHKLVLHDIAMCLVDARRSSANSMIHMVNDIRRCSRKHLYHCAKSKIEKDVEAVRYRQVLFDRNVHCGKVILRPIAAVSRGLETDIRIRGTKGYIIHFHMLLFDFEWCSLGCRSHGMGISDSADAVTVWFCGRRTPWSMVLRGSDIQLHIQVVHDRHKHALFFYNKLKADWVEHYTVNLHYHPVMHNFRHNFPLFSHLDVFRMMYYTIHMIVPPMQEVRVNRPAMDSDVVFAFYDGPGPLSQQRHLPNHPYYITTYGFHAYFTFRIQTSQNLIFNLQAINRHITKEPSKHKCMARGTIVLADHKNFPTIFCFHMFHSRVTPLRLNIHKFTFSGPTMLDSSGDLDDCQYGGIFIYIGMEQTVSLCTDRHQHYMFNNGSSLHLLIIWYKGYSTGYLHAEVENESCRTIHLDLQHSVFSHHQMILHNTDGCLRVMCPSLNYDGQLCKITFKNPDRTIGIAGVVLKTHNALYACVGQSDYYNKTYTISALDYREWPFTQLKHDKISKPLQLYNYSTFLNLYEYNISIPYVCQNGTHFNQFGVILSRAFCIMVKMGEPHFKSVQAGKHTFYEMTKECMYFTYKVEPEEMATFLYFKTKTRQTGVTFLASYNNRCPNECKNYTYVLKVWDKSGNHTRLYNGVVGNYTLQFTGYYHDGFMLQVIPPTNPCSPETGCTINVACTPPIYPIGTRNSSSFLNDNQLMQIYQRR